ncbi:GNAT family N-acetyltransferase [Zobellia alginiliquefaciens]|uniref:GNAT family N-acetyltransferase n=1 Tax=Zobellia alginiliquefaciens TaxID=3032586 RepID=UPI0023E44662|nr:N-acetyltransferase [Zobellia alginiliquefaciens]
MSIRLAKPEDAKPIAALMLLATKDFVFTFIGEKSISKATQFLERLISEPGNQYSYENCWILENEDGVIAVANVYDGADLHKLRAPVTALIKSWFKRDFTPEDETSSGEFYIDSLAVRPDQQGKGIGSKILRFLIHEYVTEQNGNLGLLVEKDNPNAKNLYLKTGFESIGDKILTGKVLEHLQVKNTNHSAPKVK